KHSLRSFCFGREGSCMGTCSLCCYFPGQRSCANSGARDPS
nr:hypothetical protein [Tanacetum cinerariifolium]